MSLLIYKWCSSKTKTLYSRRDKYIVMAKKISLTQGQFALVDDEDYEWLNQWKWIARWSENTKSYYVLRTKYYNEGNKRKHKTIYLGREIMQTPEGLVCDHINHDTLDYSKTNLRNVSVRQNNQNRRDGISKYPGVIWHKRDKKWQAQITINGKCKFLGYFDDEREAAKAYEKALREKCGEELICKL